MRLAAEAGCWFVQNPRSNAANRVGYPKALAATDRVALGTLPLTVQPIAVSPSADWLLAVEVPTGTAAA